MRRALALGLLLAAFFTLRLPSLRLLPLYSDEGLGLWRAERVLEGSLTRGAGEGKPLHAWMIAAAIALPGDDLGAARAAHVVAGALLLVALWDLTRRALGEAVAGVAAALWIVLPFPALFERTVTPDVPLAAATVAVAACALRVAQGDPFAPARWRGALLVAGAVALFVKMPIGLVPAAIPLAIPWALPAEARPAARSRLRPYVLALAGMVAVLAAIVAARAALGIRPIGFGLHELGLKVAVVKEPGHAREDVVESLRRVAEYGGVYLGPVAALLLIAGVAGAWLARQRLLRLLTAFSLAWIALFVATARDLSAHYLLAALPFLVAAMAWVLVEIAVTAARARPATSAAIVVAGVLAVAIPAWPFHRALWSDPSRAPLASTERHQYVEGEWSGYGLPEAARWIGAELARSATPRAGAGGGGATAPPLFVAIHLADFERLRLYAAEDARAAITQVQVDRHTIRVPAMIDRVRSLLASGRRVLIVVGSERRFEHGWRQAFPTATLRAAFPKPGGADQAVVWDLAPTAAIEPTMSAPAPLRTSP